MVSVITQTKNCAKFIARAVDSIVSQGAESIVVDCVSDDGTAEIARKHGAIVLSEPDTGQYNAYNKGVALAHGEILGWVPGDDWLLPDAIKTVEEEMNDGTQWMYGYCQIWRNGEYWHTAGKTEATPRNMINGNVIPASSAFFRKNFLIEMGMVDESLQLTGDYELWLRFLTKCPPKWVHKELSVFDMHGQNLGITKADEVRREDLEVKKKYSFFRR